MRLFDASERARASGRGLRRDQSRYIATALHHPHPLHARAAHLPRPTDCCTVLTPSCGLDDGGISKVSESGGGWDGAGRIGSDEFVYTCTVA